MRMHTGTTVAKAVNEVLVLVIFTDPRVHDDDPYFSSILK
jgi:hypothetical protein